MILSTDKITLKSVTIILEFALSSFDAIYERSFKFRLTEFQGFFTLAMIKIIYPLSLIKWADLINEYSEAVLFSILPLALIDITIWISHAAKTVEQLIFHLSFIFATVLKLDCTNALENTISFSPLTTIVVAITDVDPTGNPSQIRLGQKIL